MTRRLRDRDSADLIDRLRFALLLGLAMAIPGTVLVVLVFGTGLPIPLVILVTGIGMFAVGWGGYPILGVVSRGASRSLIAQGGDPVRPTYSEQEALVAAGRVGDAVDSFRARLVAFPDDVEARIRLAALLTGLGRPTEARHQYGEARTRAATVSQRLRISTGLATVHRGTGNLDALRAELSHCARAFPGAAAGERAQRELRALAVADADAAPRDQPG